VWPCTGPQLPKIRPRRNTHSQKATFGEGQLPWGGRPCRVATGFCHPRRAPLRRAVAGDRHDGARGGGNLKYEFRLKPGASIEDVRLATEGPRGSRLGPGGAAGADLPWILKDVAPASYQWIGDESQPSKSGSRARVESRMGRTAAFRNGLEDPVTQKVSESKSEWLR
jgi:hypothetical protein